MLAIYADTLAVIVEADGSIKPAQAVARCRSILVENSSAAAADFPSEKTLRSNVSILKTAMKRREKSSLM